MSDTWIKLDVDFPTHPKILEVGPIAGWAFLAALCYSRRYLTDGVISYEAVHAAYSLIEHQCGEEIASPQALASLLTDAGLLEANGAGWVIHDYAEHQQTKQMVQEQREALSRIRSQAGRKGGQASAEARRSKTKLEVEVEKERTPLPREAGANPRAKGTNPRATGESPRQQGLSPRQLARYTGCKHTRGTHGTGYKHTPLGMDKPPPDWPHPAPSEKEVAAALAAAADFIKGAGE